LRDPSLGALGGLRGRVEGEVRVLIKQLGKKFGPLSAALSDRIRNASAEELDRWTERVLSATTLAEVLE